MFSGVIPQLSLIMGPCAGKVSINIGGRLASYPAPPTLKKGWEGLGTRLEGCLGDACV